MVWEGRISHSPSRIGLLLRESLQTTGSRLGRVWRILEISSLPALIAAGLVVLGGCAAEAVVASSFGLVGESRGGENRLTESLATSTPTPDTGGGTVIATIPVGHEPYGVAYNSGNGYVYVANSYSNNVSVIDGTTVVATIPDITYPVDAAYDTANEYVYVTNSI